MSVINFGKLSVTITSNIFSVLPSLSLSSGALIMYMTYFLMLFHRFFIFCSIFLFVYVCACFLCISVGEVLIPIDLFSNSLIFFLDQVKYTDGSTKATLLMHNAWMKICLSGSDYLLFSDYWFYFSCLL